MGRIQKGCVYEASRTFFVRYYAEEIVDGEPQRVQRSAVLCAGPDGNYDKNGAPCKRGPEDTYYIKKVRGKKTLSPALKLVLNSFMQPINSHKDGTQSVGQNMRIADFWEQRYLPYCEEIVKLTGKPRKKPSTVRGYKQIWRQHLSKHFGNRTLREYEPEMGTQFLESLKDTQSKTTLKHIKALGGSIFKRAMNPTERRIKVNPWRDVVIPEDALESDRTKHYTLAEAEDMVSALVEHVDCQLIIALSCFLGLRPGEVAALRWEDFDSEYVHIRRCVVRGYLDTPKTLESVAPLPLIDQVRVPLELWRNKCSNPSEGWVFDSAGVLREDHIIAPDMKYLANGPAPADLHNVISRIIIPHVNGGKRCIPCDRVPKRSSVTWKGLYSGRRGACTAAVEATNGNYAVAQALLRHKSMKTTLDVYKKQITPQAFKEGMKLLEKAATANGK